MAEFKLGRIRFVWKNDWSGTTTYYKDDVVAYGGRIYICVIGHTSASNFFTDLDIVPSKWNLVSDGFNWKGDWQPNEYYIYNDIVRYGSKLYICIGVHTSAVDSTAGLEGDIGNWQTYAEGLDWKGDWSTGFDYKENDLVKYGGNTFVCNTGHISAATEADGLELDQSKWDVFNAGFEWKTDWAPSTRYKKGDVVKFGGALWIAETGHSSSSAFGNDSAYWTKFVEGVQWENEWNYLTSYQPGDIVQYGGNKYIALTDNDNAIPPSSTDDWDLFANGFKFLGDWAEDSTQYEYKIGDVVRLGGYTYRCILDHQNQQPAADSTYWERLNSGFEWRGQWMDDAQYYEGDVVRYGDNSYVCIQNHISEGDDYSSLSSGAEGSRPDLADSGQFWSVLAIGSETSVLTTTGDLVYYAEGSPQRLPIGQDGQVLKVSSDGLPKWEFLGQSQDVYYVAEHGVDSPAPIYGKNWDRPFKTIRYATEQIEKGSKVPDTAELLRLNRRFIQREIVEWTNYQITNNIAPFTSAFNYDTKKCERDMGLIVDAFIYDLTHGGNEKSRAAALSYVEDGSSLYTLGQEAETVASINYGLTVIGHVLAQTDPAVNYQITNGDSSSRVVSQYKNTTLGDQSVIEYEGTITGGSTGGTASSPAGPSNGGYGY